MGIAGNLLSLAEKLRRFNETLPETVDSISVSSYFENNEIGSEVLAIPTIDIDLLALQISAELSTELFCEIRNKLLAEIHHFFKWYHEQGREVVGDVGFQIIFKECRQKCNIINEKYSRQVKDALMQEQIFEDLFHAYISVKKRARFIKDFTGKDLDHLYPYYHKVLEITGATYYDFKEISNDYNNAVHNRESIINERDSYCREIEKDAQQRIQQVKPNIYNRVIQYVTPIAEYLESINLDTMDKRCQKGRPGTPKTIDSIEKCFCLKKDFEIFISTIEKYINEGKRFTGENCCQAYHYLIAKQKLSPDLKSFNKFGDLLHKSFPNLYQRKTSNSVIYIKKQNDIDGFLTLLDEKYQEKTQEESKKSAGK